MVFLVSLQLQISGFDPRPCRVLNICATFFSTKAHSVFHPSKISKQSTRIYRDLTCDGLVSAPGRIIRLALHERKIMASSIIAIWLVKDLALASGAGLIREVIVYQLKYMCHLVMFTKLLLCIEHYLKLIRVVCI